MRDDRYNWGDNCERLIDVTFSLRMAPIKNEQQFRDIIDSFEKTISIFFNIYPLDLVGRSTIVSDGPIIDDPILWHHQRKGKSPR